MEESPPLRSQGQPPLPRPLVHITFADDDSLVVSGRLSSLDIVNILVSLEETCGLVVNADEFDPIKFDTVDSIIELLGEGEPH